MGPTYGGAIGSQGMGDPVYLFALCSAVPAVHSDMGVCHGALYCISQDGTDLDTDGYLLMEVP